MVDTKSKHSRNIIQLLSTVAPLKATVGPGAIRVEFGKSHGGLN